MVHECILKTWQMCSYKKYIWISKIQTSTRPHLDWYMWNDNRYILLISYVIKCLLTFLLRELMQKAWLADSHVANDDVFEDVWIIIRPCRHLVGYVSSPPENKYRLGYLLYIKLQCPFVCLSVCTPFFRCDCRTTTKFGTHIRMDMGLALT